MDRSHFDALARLVSTKQSRRTALVAVLGATLLRHHPDTVLAKDKGKAKAKPCYPGSNCTPGKGKNTSGCDFTSSTAFFERDVRGSNLSHGNFTGAQLAKADFRGANLSGGCFVDANLLEAKLGSSVNLGNAIFCRTLMPDGSINDRDCDKGTACCPTVCQGPDCEDTCREVLEPCTIIFSPCCDNLLCTPMFPLGPTLVTTCQHHCTSDAECTAIDGDLTCKFDPVACLWIGNCCVPKSCSTNDDCDGNTCCHNQCCIFGATTCGVLPACF